MTETDVLMDVSSGDDTASAFGTVEGDHDPEPAFDVLSADIPDSVTVGQEFDVAPTVKNDGDEDGDRPIELLLTDDFNPPIDGINPWRLTSQALSLEPGESATVDFKVPAEEWGRIPGQPFMHDDVIITVNPQPYGGGHSGEMDDLNNEGSTQSGLDPNNVLEGAGILGRHRV